MGSSAAGLRALVVATMEASTVGRYVITSTPTPSARAFILMEAAGIRCLGSDPQGARPNAGGESSRALVGIPPRPRACAPAPRSLELSLVVEDEGAEVGILPRPRALSLPADEASASEMGIRPRPLATRPRALFFLAARSVWDEDNSLFQIAGIRPHLLASSPRALFLLAARSVGDDDHYLNTSAQIAGNRPRSFLGGASAGGAIFLRPAARPMCLHPMSGLQLILTRGQRQFSTSAWMPRGANTLGSYAQPKTGLPSDLTVGRYHFSSSAWTPRGSNMLGSWTKPQRMFAPPSILPIRRRHYTDWAWTPWSPNRPKDAKTKAKELDDVIKFLRELEASPEVEKKLKEAFFDKFYAGKDDDPKSVHLKLDLLLHKVDETTRLAKDIKGQKKWGTFRFLGKKLDLSSLTSIGTAIATAISGMF